MATNGQINNRAALRALTQEYSRLQDEMLEGFRVNLVNENFFQWEVGIFGPPDTLYAGGYFRAELCFPPDYPFSPPTMCFLTKIWHPNVYKTGKVCISILNAPTGNYGEDPTERWNPTQNVRTILLSVISLLNEPNIMSPANGIAAFLYRRYCETKGKESRYRDIVLQQVLESKQYALDRGIKVPTTREEYCIKHLPETSVDGEKPVYDESSFLLFGNDSEDEEEDEEEEEEEEEEEQEQEQEQNGEQNDEQNDEQESKKRKQEEEQKQEEQPKRAKEQEEANMLPKPA